MTDENVDASKVPVEVRAKLAELELELSEGDITRKGFEKKRQRLLGPYAKQAGVSGANPAQPSPKTAAQRKHHRRLTREDNRYHSEIRTEAVMQALAMQKKQSVIPMPSKRTSAVYSPRRKEMNTTGASSRLQHQNSEVYDDLTDDDDEQASSTSDNVASVSEQMTSVPEQPTNLQRNNYAVFCIGF